MGNLKIAIASVLLVGFALIAGCLTPGVQTSKYSIEEWDNLKLWYDKPASKWTEALPVGNGRLGAMVFGTVETEQIQLNEDTVWADEFVERDRVGAYKYLDEARHLIFEGKYTQAQKLIQQRFMGQEPRSS